MNVYLRRRDSESRVLLGHATTEELRFDNIVELVKVWGLVDGHGASPADDIEGHFFIDPTFETAGFEIVYDVRQEQHEHDHA